MSDGGNGMVETHFTPAPHPDRCQSLPGPGSSGSPFQPSLPPSHPLSFPPFLHEWPVQPPRLQCYIVMVPACPAEQDGDLMQRARSPAGLGNWVQSETSAIDSPAGVLQLECHHAPSHCVSRTSALAHLPTNSTWTAAHRHSSDSAELSLKP